MKKNLENNLDEPLSVTEDDMMIIVAVAKAMRKYSKNKSVGDLAKDLELEEICNVDVRHKIVWQKPMLDLLHNVEKKFSNRIKQLRKAGKIK